ncbi:hypothetical protein D3C72_1322050 [compost metagenome]
MRRVENDHPRSRAQRFGELLPINSKLAIGKLDMHAAPAGQFDRRLIAVIARVEDNHFVTGTDDRMNSAEDRFCGPWGDGDLSFSIDTDAIATGDLGRDLLAQGGQSGHWAILVVSSTDMPAYGIEQGLGAIEIGKTLGQVQGAGLRGELGHGGKDGRADVRQLAADHGALFPANQSGSRRRGQRPSIAD